jgi:hypothetical protein
LNRNESGRFGALKSDSTHHFSDADALVTMSKNAPLLLFSGVDKGNNKITELQTTLQRESQNS